MLAWFQRFVYATYVTGQLDFAEHTVDRAHDERLATAGWIEDPAQAVGGRRVLETGGEAALDVFDLHETHRPDAALEMYALGQTHTKRTMITHAVMSPASRNSSPSGSDASARATTGSSSPMRMKMRLSKRKLATLHIASFCTRVSGWRRRGTCRPM